MKESLVKKLMEGTAITEDLIRASAQAMSTEEFVDFTVKIKAMNKNLEKLSEQCTNAIKDGVLGGQPGVVIGEQFKATMIKYDNPTFQEKVFKAQNPILAAQYTKDIPTTRLTFEPR